MMWAVSGSSDHLPAPMAPTAMLGRRDRDYRRQLWSEGAAYDLFDTTGRYVGSVTPPPMSRILRVAGDAAWRVDSSAHAVPIAIRWQLVPARRPPCSLPPWAGVNLRPVARFRTPRPTTSLNLLR